MNFITFKKLCIENFLSVGTNALCIDFNNRINVITGQNLDKEDSKNGVGKSTIVDALHFALYGTPIREISKEQIVNSSIGKNCKVALTFIHGQQNNTAEYCITRTISPTKCTITKDGVNVTLSTMAKTTEFIQELLKCSSKVFQNSVVMSINSTIPFLAQSKVDKRKYIENMFQLEVFSQMLLRARDDYNEEKHAYDLTRVKHTSNISTVEMLQQQLNVFEEEKNKQINELEQLLLEKQDELKKLDKVCIEHLAKKITKIDFSNDIKKLKDTLSPLESQITDLKEKRTAILTEQSVLRKQLKQFADKTKPCPTCNRSFSDASHNHQEVLSDLQIKIDTFTTDGIDKKISNIATKTQSLNDALDKCRLKEKEQISQDSKHQNLTTQLNSKIEFLNEQIIKIQKDIEIKKQKTNTSILTALAKVIAEKTQSEEANKKHEEQLKILDCVKYILSEEGVKTFLIKKVLKVLNQKITQYLLALQAPVKCEFNEFFDERIFDEKNNERSYFNFSGGERKRIDLACLFAFMDMKRLQGETVFNTTFYDELLDSSLDSVGVDLVLDVLRDRNKKYDEGCYLITHRGSHILDKVDNIINLEKRNGFTYILK